MLLVILSALYASATAQITVGAATFPKAGDTLSYAFDTAPTINAATPPGGNQTWDFSALQTTEVDQTIFSPTSAGTNKDKFPGADMVLLGTSGETYYNATNTKWENMGFVGSQAGSFNTVVTAKYSPVLTERHAPLNFFDIFQQESNLNLPFSTAALPDTLLAALPIKPDSIRVKTNLKRTEVVDGWGVCKIPGGNYPVLRMKRTEYTKTGIDIKIGFFWLDLSQLLPAGTGGALGNLLSPDTTVTYRFLSNTDKEEIAVVTMDPTLSKAERVRFKNNETTSAEEVSDFAPGSASIQAFPNPAIEWVRFDCSNIPSGNYTLKIFNIIGKVIWRQNLRISGSHSVRVELDKFKKGTYLYSLVDGKGNIIGTKRLVIIKP